jgi:hypothetical protein
MQTADLLLTNRSLDHHRRKSVVEAVNDGVGDRALGDDADDVSGPRPVGAMEDVAAPERRRLNLASTRLR